MKTNSDLYFEHGCEMLINAFNTNQPLLPVLQRAREASWAGDPGVLEGVLQIALAIVNSNHGVKCTGEAARVMGSTIESFIDINILFKRREYEAAELRMAILMATLEGIRRATKGMQVSRCFTPPSPQRIEVVSMPQRTTVSEVERDHDGNILKTHQIQSDEKVESL